MVWSGCDRPVPGPPRGEAPALGLNVLVTGLTGVLGRQVRRSGTCGQPVPVRMVGDGVGQPRTGQVGMLGVMVGGGVAVVVGSAVVGAAVVADGPPDGPVDGTVGGAPGLVGPAVV